MPNTATPDGIRSTLRKLGFVPHHTGHKLLITAILLYTENPSQSITKELYPALAKQSRMYSVISIERSIRYAIAEAWKHGLKSSWQQYFPQQEKAPSNAHFIATMAEH